MIPIIFFSLREKFFLELSQMLHIFVKKKLENGDIFSNFYSVILSLKN